MFYSDYMLAVYGFSALRSEIVYFNSTKWQTVAAYKFSILGKNYVSFLIISEQHSLKKHVTEMAELSMETGLECGKIGQLIKSSSIKKGNMMPLPLQ